MNTNKTIKPCVFFGVLIMGSAVFIFLIAFLKGFGESVYPFVVQHLTTEPFLVMFFSGFLLFTIGVIPALISRSRVISS